MDTLKRRDYLEFDELEEGKYYAVVRYKFAPDENSFKNPCWIGAVIRKGGAKAILVKPGFAGNPLKEFVGTAFQAAANVENKFGFVKVKKEKSYV